jgi:SAM-dependent methyltransferase
VTDSRPASPVPDDVLATKGHAGPACAPGKVKPDGYYGQARESLVLMLRRPLGRVLDVGCGEGAAEPALRASGATHITGIEIMPEPARRAGERYDHVASADAMAALPSLDGPFDTILCYDVLEHVADPEALLRALRARAASRAQLHISTPNARHWSLVRDLVLRGTFGYSSFGHRDTTHLRWFTRADLDVLLKRTGWIPRSWSSSAIQRLGELRMPRPERWWPRLGSEFFANQWFVLADTDRT